ncbi:hypothetical protein BVX95_00145 [archaeon D22]|nr:hypothetical protein BVX95_00145 [archaeon D22]
MAYETLGETLEYLQYFMIISIPLFGWIYKDAFLFFVPIVIFLILGFGFVKKKIIEGATQDQITNTIFSIGRWTLFLWILEFAIYFMIKFSFGSI